MEIIDRHFQDPRESFFLFGPRGTGKSTWVNYHCKNPLRFDLLGPDTFRAFSAKPERLREIVHANPEKKVIVIDEIQKIPELLTVVHSLIEEKLGRQFILTGSSARKLKRTGVDLLAGRALHCTLHPFMASELKEHFKFENVLRLGMLPLVLASNQPEEVLKAYITLYLREEVQAEGIVRNLGNFSRFLEALSFSHASVLNISNVARECEIERKVVEGYVGIVEDLLLGFRIPVFEKRAKRAVALHPKFYFFDAGVFRSIRPSGPLDHPEEIEGRALEGLVAQHLRAWIAYRGGSNRLYFWRTRTGSEIDFVIYGIDGLWAVEVKNTSKIRPEDLRSLRNFQEDYPESKTFFLYRGNQRLLRQKILCLPCEDFLLNLPPENLPQV
jgi:predicted AAA+ superfamily ATPase